MPTTKNLYGLSSCHSKWVIFFAAMASLVHWSSLLPATTINPKIWMRRRLSYRRLEASSAHLNCRYEHQELAFAFTCRHRTMVDFGSWLYVCSVWWCCVLVKRQIRSILRDSFSGVMKYFKTLVGLFLVSEALVGRNYRRAVYCCFLDMLLKWLLPEEASEKLFECMQMYLSLALHAVCGLVLYSLSLEANAAP